MKKRILLIILLFGISSYTCWAQEFKDSITDPNFVYSPEDIPQYIRKAADTKPARIQYAFEQAADYESEESFRSYFAQLWLATNLDQVNEDLFNIFTTKDSEIRKEYGLHDYWHLSNNQWFYHMYYAFGANGRVSPGRLYPETEKALLELFWRRMEYKDDIHLARKSTWWMIGSENHDIVAKVSSLITSQIFMNEPEFKDRVYPDLGLGGGYKFWFHSMYGDNGIDGPKPRGKSNDGKEYTAADHYKAWVEYFDTYFTERTKKGFFLEVASPHYMVVSVPYLTDIFDLVGDEALARKAGQFLDAVWADWAVDQLNGVRGGAKTRVKDGTNWAGAMYNLGRFYFGGEGSAAPHYFTQLLSSYELKPIIWDIALDRRGLREFAYISRKPGEEENTWPRPLGTERTMLTDTESRLVRYSWITPDYILGAQMDHPAAVHSHLSVQARWLGITFKGEGGPRVFPTDVAVDTKGWTNEHALVRAVQSENVMIVQQSRRWFQVNPDWYPAKIMTNKEYGIYFGDGHDRLVEKGGWIFVAHGNAYLAVRVVLGNDDSPGLHSALVEESYSWSGDKKMIRLKDKYSGMIFEASRRAHHKTFGDFMDDILDNPLTLDKTVVAGFNILRYRGSGEDAEEIYFNLANNEISMIGGERVDYAPEMLFDSPYIQSKYKSGVIEITKDDMQLTLDFNK